MAAIHPNRPHEFPLATRISTPEIDKTDYQTFIAMPKSSVPALVAEYVELITTQVTSKYCTCEWIINPADVELPPAKQRMRRGEESADCWIHTKAGFLLGFFTWVFQERQAQEKADTELILNTIHLPVPQQYGSGKHEVGCTLFHEPDQPCTFPFEVLPRG